MIQYTPLPSFIRTFDRLSDSNRQRAVIAAIDTLQENFERRQLKPGLGLKRLKNDIWEIRSTLKDRIVFRWTGNHIYFTIVGSHDEIRRYLRSI